jgi:hypothetical protein
VAGEQEGLQLRRQACPSLPASLPDCLPALADRRCDGALGAAPEACAPRQAGRAAGPGRRAARAHARRDGRRGGRPAAALPVAAARGPAGRRRPWRQARWPPARRARCPVRPRRPAGRPTRRPRGRTARAALKLHRRLRWGRPRLAGRRLARQRARRAGPASRSPRPGLRARPRPSRRRRMRVRVGVRMGRAPRSPGLGRHAQVRLSRRRRRRGTACGPRRPWPGGWAGARRRRASTTPATLPGRRCGAMRRPRWPPSAPPLRAPPVRRSPRSCGLVCDCVCTVPFEAGCKLAHGRRMDVVRRAVRAENRPCRGQACSRCSSAAQPGGGRGQLGALPPPQQQVCALLQGAQARAAPVPKPFVLHALSSSLGLLPVLRTTIGGLRVCTAGPGTCRKRPCTSAGDNRIVRVSFAHHAGSPVC